MNSIRLVKANAEDASLVQRLQREAFMPLYERYHDDGTSPAFETVSGVAEKIAYSDFLIIYLDDTPVGGVRVRRFENDGEVARNISPLFVIPQYWDKGIGSEVMKVLFDTYFDADKWTLATIEEDVRNCHFYEKHGFIPTGTRSVINERMTIIGYEKRC
ncbi:GNAT family N-acetyltransferase [Ruminococcus albus]|uniref:GNAT family N-acetyltransferase n=1 Tax=Ruminococcus albus TaxID=1264 RepID=UPI000464A44A|nr:GNAT family N-acetyltransferase [Ruminococcus albus]